MIVSRQFVLSTFIRAIKSRQRHAKSGQSKADLAVIYNAFISGSKWSCREVVKADRANNKCLAD